MTDGGEQGPGDDARGARDVPPQLGVHRSVASRAGLAWRPPSAVTTMAWMSGWRSRASGPPRKRALVSASARQARSATTLTATAAPAAGRPVAGSMRWWAGPALVCHRRRRRLEVATAPSGSENRASSCPGRSGVGQADRPAAGVGRIARGPEVAPEVDERAEGAGVEERLGDEVGGQALADAAGVEAHPGGQRHGAALGVELDPGRPGAGPARRWSGRGDGIRTPRRSRGRSRARRGRRRRSGRSGPRSAPTRRRRGRPARRCRPTRRPARRCAG